MNTHRSLARRTVLALALVLPAAFAVTPGTALAASSPIKLTLFVESECFSGWATPRSTVSYKWKDAAGNLKQQAEVQASDSGGLWYSDCVEFSGPYIEPGDKFVVDDGHSTHRFTVPALTIELNRLTDRAKGTAPASSHIRLEYLYPAYSGFDIVIDVRKLGVGPDGKWSFDLGSRGYEVSGGDAVGIVWKSDQGDRVFMYTEAPFVVVTIGKSDISGVANRYTTAEVFRSDGPSSDPNAWDEIQMGVSQSFSGTLRDGGGDPVSVQVGDQIESNVAPDSNFLVPDIQFTADAATDRVTGKCFDAGRFTQSVHIATYRTGIRRGYAYSYATSDGTFDQHIGQNNWPRGATLKSGDKVLVQCFLVNGDIVQKWGDVL